MEGEYEKSKKKSEEKKEAEKLKKANREIKRLSLLSKSG